MAEASLVQKVPNLKKRKTENVKFGTNKKQMLMSDVTKTVNKSTSGVDVDDSQSVLSNVIGANDLEVRKIYHIGGSKYMIFHGTKGFVENIYLKDWDGKKINSSVTLNISKFVMILHSSELTSINLDKVCAGDKEVSYKMHIGELFYITCTSPYKIVQIRKWRRNREDELFPTKDGISLKAKEWRELVKFSNDMYSEKLELFQTVPCLLDPNVAGHDNLTCSECSVLNQDAKGVVDMEIPL